MAAVIVPSTASVQPDRHPVRDRRPALRVIDGGRSPANRAMQRVYLRRRLGAIVGLALVAAVLWLAATGAVALVQGPATTQASSAATAAAPPAAAEAYIVQPGDTLWVIARRLEPDGDIRPVVDELADRTGGSVLQPGQRLDVSGLGG